MGQSTEFPYLLQPAILQESPAVHQPEALQTQHFVSRRSFMTQEWLITSLAIGDWRQSSPRFPSQEIGGRTGSSNPPITWLAPQATSFGLPIISPSSRRFPEVTSLTKPRCGWKGIVKNKKILISPLWLCSPFRNKGQETKYHSKRYYHWSYVSELLSFEP